MRTFADPGSFWYAPLTDDAPLHPDSVWTAPRLARQFRYSLRAAGHTATVPQGYYSPKYQVVFNQRSYSTALWVVDSTQVPPVRVQWLTENGRGPAASGGSGNGLQALLQEVPLPPDPGLNLTSEGTDGSCAVYDTATDTLYEFWQLRRDHTAPYDNVSYPWTCSHGGVLLNASRSRGIFPHAWGTSASGSSTACGLIKLDEVAVGVIGHVVRCGIPVTGPGVYPPFTRFDAMTAVPRQPAITSVARRASAGDRSLVLAGPLTGFAPDREWIVNPGGATQETVTIHAWNPDKQRAWIPALTQQPHEKGEPIQISPRADRVSEGALFRFPADVVIPDGLSPLTRALMVAIRDHGLLVADSGGVVAFSIEATESLGTPYQSAGLDTNPVDIAEEVAGCYLQMLPWEQLQQITIPSS